MWVALRRTAVTPTDDVAQLAAAQAERDVLRERIVDLEATVSDDAQTAALLGPLRDALSRVERQVATLERDRLDMAEQAARAEVDRLKAEAARIRADVEREEGMAADAKRELDRLEAAANKAVRDPRFARSLERDGLELAAPAPRAAFAREVRDEYAFWGRKVRELDLKAE